MQQKHKDETKTKNLQVISNNLVASKQDSKVWFHVNSAD